MTQDKNAPKIDRKNNLILTLMDEDSNINKVYIPEPTQQSFNSILKVLQKFYAMSFMDSIPVDVIVRDYAEIVKEILDGDEIAIKRVDSFINRSLLGSTIFTHEGEFVPYAECKWSDEEKAICEGTLLFVSALYRYVPIQARKKGLKDILTSQTLEDWKISCLDSFKEQEAEAEWGDTIEG